MNRLVGKWVDSSSGTHYEFANYASERGWQRKNGSRSWYSVIGNTLLMTVKATEPQQEIELTFSDDGNQVKLDQVDGSRGVCLTRIETEN